MPWNVRICVWLGEMIVEALSCCFLLIWMSHPDAPVTLGDIIFVTFETLIFFGISGYALTTLLTRLALRGKWARIYPVIAAVLFLVHFQLLNMSTSQGLMDAHGRLVFRLVGFAVVLVAATIMPLVVQRFFRNRSSDEQVLLRLKR